MSLSPREALPWKKLYPEDPSDHRQKATFSGTVISRRLYLGLRDGDKIALAIALGDKTTVIRLVETIPTHHDDLMHVQEHHQVTAEYLICADGGPTLTKFTVDWGPAIKAIPGTSPLTLSDALDQAPLELFHTVQAVSDCTLWGATDAALRLKIRLVTYHLKLPPGVVETALPGTTGNRLAALERIVKLSGRRRTGLGAVAAPSHVVEGQESQPEQ